MQIPSSPKCVSLRALSKIIQSKKFRNKKMVFTNGCFDILHVGHVAYLETAKKMGDYLVVALNSDSSVRKLKGPNRPLNPQRARARVLAGLESVDFITIFNTKRVTPVLTRLKPKVYVKGGDYTPATLDPGEKKTIESYQGTIKILPVWKGFSTTTTLTRIQKQS